MQLFARLFAYLLLALSLSVISLPGHGAVELQSVPAPMDAETDCPFHKAMAVDALQELPESEPANHDCCGSDCRCACGSLSVLGVQRFQSPLTPAHAGPPSSANDLLATLRGSDLLRPPQA
jgi:hypothetical protein